MEPISLNKNNQRKETEAYKASVEIDQILHDEGIGNYRPWQLENYDVSINTLKTTYEELFILWKEEARFRTGFKAENGKVMIPNLFAKISGTHKDLQMYWNELQELRKDKKSTIFISSVPFTNFKLSYTLDQSLLNEDGLFDKEKIIEIAEYKFSYLKSSVQNLILDKINEIINGTILLKYPMTLEMKFKVLHTILNLDERFLRLIQRFDYPFKVPKIVVFDSSKELFNQEDYIILSFLHLIGFDIAVFTPTGYNNLENGIHSDYFDVHKLEDLRYHLTLSQQPKIDNKGNVLSSTVPQKNRAIAGLLAIFFGTLGIHKFYMGRPLQGLCMLVFCWTFVPTIYGIVEGVSYLKGDDRSFNRKIYPINRSTTAMLSIFLGWLGIHKFYMGKCIEGILYILFSFTLIPLILSIREGIGYLNMSDETFAEQY